TAACSSSTHGGARWTGCSGWRGWWCTPRPRGRRGPCPGWTSRRPRRSASGWPRWDPTAMTSEPQLSGRLHPAALALAPLRAAGPLALLVVTGSVTAGLRRAAVVLVVAAGLSVLVAVARWARFTWAVTADAVVIEQGLVSRRRRVIPLARVQGVDLVRT